MDRTLETYYRRRAAEYDEVYEKPERQSDISTLTGILQAELTGRTVLEVAAGTGFWTQRVSKTAASILATDLAEETLAVARQRDYGAAEVELAVCDALSLESAPGEFDAGLAAFWLSHLRRDQCGPFLARLSSRLLPGSRIVLADNRYVEGSNHPICLTDPEGNTFQHRTLGDGEQYEILKNFFDEPELKTLASPFDGSPRIVLLDYYWVLSLDI